ncbi:hypothetical protein Trydic_g17902 [Trypoxylus dichotomus]
MKSIIATEKGRRVITAEKRRRKRQFSSSVLAAAKSIEKYSRFAKLIKKLIKKQTELYGYQIRYTDCSNPLSSSVGHRVKQSQNCVERVQTSIWKESK